jgi:hypothetical protein
MNPVILATETTDCLVPAAKARALAQHVANEQGEPVTVRHPISDRVLFTARPLSKKVFGKASRIT